METRRFLISFHFRSFQEIPVFDLKSNVKETPKINKKKKEILTAKKKSQRHVLGRSSTVKKILLKLNINVMEIIIKQCQLVDP